MRVRPQEPSLLCEQYRREWIRDWKMEGERGQRWIRSALVDMEALARGDEVRGLAPDLDLCAAIEDLRRAVAVEG